MRGSADSRNSCYPCDGAKTNTESFHAEARFVEDVDGPRFFAPTEAIAQLPAVKPLLSQLREAFHEYVFAKAQVDELSALGEPGPELDEWERKARDLSAKVEALIRAINEL